MSAKSRIGAALLPKLLSGELRLPSPQLRQAGVRAANVVEEKA
jgi:hypothetical protein